MQVCFPSSAFEEKRGERRIARQSFGFIASFYFQAHLSFVLYYPSGQTLLRSTSQLPCQAARGRWIRLTIDRDSITSRGLTLFTLQPLIRFAPHKKQSPLGEADSCSVGHKSSPLFWNLNIHYRAQYSQNLWQVNSVSALTSRNLNILFILILFLYLLVGFAGDLVPSGFLNKMLSHHSQACYIPHPSIIS